MDVPIYTCECGFPCYSESQKEYHESKACLRMKRLTSVMHARERIGHKNHEGLEVNGMVVHKL